MARVIVIIKKEDEKNWKSYKSIREFKRKGIVYILYVLKWKLKKHEVEEVIIDGKNKKRKSIRKD